MLSLPDFREKQILFVNIPEHKNAHLRFHNENICFEQDDKIINQASCYKLLAVFVIGDCTVTTIILKKCKEYGVSIFFLNDRFRTAAQLLAQAEGNYMLRSLQYHDTSELVKARHIVWNKVQNQCALLRQVDTSAGIDEYQKSVHEKINIADSIDSLRGIEGTVSKKFFSGYFEDMGWYRRMPRTRVDEINLLMDIGYTMLFNFMDALIALYGFDAYKGFYHQLFFQRKSLVCDIMEPFRCVIDKQILKAYHLKQVNQKDFFLKNGQYVLEYKKQQKYIALFAEALMHHKEEMFEYVRDYYYAVINATEKYPAFLIE